MKNIYDNILKQLADGEMKGLQKSIYYLLKASPDGLTRHELVEKIYQYTPTDINADTNDRKIRRAISAMRNRLIPIVSNSSQAGYKLDTSRDAVQHMMAELHKRRSQLDHLLKSAAKFYDIPEYADDEVAVQGSLF